MATPAGQATASPRPGRDEGPSPAAGPRDPAHARPLRRAPSTAAARVFATRRRTLAAGPRRPLLAVVRVTAGGPNSPILLSGLSRKGGSPVTPRTRRRTS